MPVTKTAHRALRGSIKKATVNKRLINSLGVAVRLAKRSKSQEKIVKAISLSDRAAKKKVIHKNKAGRIKSQLSKLLPKRSIEVKKSTKSKSPRRS